MRKPTRASIEQWAAGVPPWIRVAYVISVPFVLYLLPAVIFTSQEGRLSSLDDLLDPSYAVTVGPAALAAPFLQLVFLMPASRAKERPGRLSVGRWIIASLALGGLAGMCAMPVLIVVQGGIEGFGLYLDPEIELIFPLGFIPGVIVAAVLVRWKWRTGIPVKASLSLAGLLCGLLVGGLVFIFQGLYDYLGPGNSGWGVLAASLAFLTSWAAATPLLWAYRRGELAESRLSRVANLIFKGTLVELVATIPLDAITRRKTTCYCTDGSFLALIICGTVGFLALGPAIYLLPAVRRARREHGLCPECGYDLRGAREPQCPECGAAVRAGDLPDRDPSAPATAQESTSPR